MKERLFILEKHRNNPNNLINKNSEIYGSCRHKPCFHRLTSSTDEATRQKELQHDFSQTNDVLTDKTCQLTQQKKENGHLGMIFS